jgi:hypothetical protein
MAGLAEVGLAATLGATELTLSPHVPGCGPYPRLMSPKKIEPSSNEVMAFKIVSNALGIEVVPYDDNSKPRMVDGLIPPDGALEIIGDHDSDFNALWSKLDKSGHTIVILGLEHGWHIRIEHTVNVNKLIRTLPGFLLDLEARGITSTMKIPEQSSGHVFDQMQALGVVTARQDPNMPKGKLQFWPEGWSGASGLGDSVLSEWVTTVLAEQRDVAPKLRDHPGVTQRHAFIWATIGSSYALQSYLEDDGPLPDSLTAPELPEGISHVWVAGSMSSQGVVAWFPDRGWWRTPWRWPATERGRVIAAKLAEVMSGEPGHVPRT